MSTPSLRPAKRKRPAEKRVRLDEDPSETSAFRNTSIRGALAREHFVPLQNSRISTHHGSQSNLSRTFTQPRSTEDAPIDPFDPAPPMASPTPDAAHAEEEPGSSGQKTKQGASRYMEDFCKHSTQVFDAILNVDSHPNVKLPCSCGRSGARRLYHCYECHSYPMACADCFLAHHQYTPFHWARSWCDEGYFIKQDISMVLPTYSATSNVTAVTIGHLAGGICPYADYSRTIQFTVVDISGVHATHAVFCDCPRLSSSGRVERLLASQIFPATFDRPALGFTFNVLRDFHQHALSSKKNAYDYVDALQRQTNDTFPHKVPDIYRQFLRAQRIWGTVVTYIESGQCHGIDEHFPHRPKGNIVTPCLACPEPGFNIDPADWEDMDDDMDHVQLLCLMLDGHFGLQRLAKVDDPDDQSLFAMLGADGLFPDDAHYNEYLARAGVDTAEKSTCSNFSAVSMQNRYKFSNCVITGVVGAECARHCSFLSVVDLQAGERYANTDFALSRALRRVVGKNSLDRAKYFKRIVVTYDVACQFSVHLRERLQINFPEISAIVDAINMFVPKFHLEGHKDDCRFRFALELLARAGRLHGEGIEQTWSEAKQAGGHTRHMNHGHRHDVLTSDMLFWNKRKGQDQQSLACSLRVAKKKRREFVDHFLGMSITYGKEKVEAWELESIEPRFENGEWTSVFRVSTTELPTQESIYEGLLRSETAVEDQRQGGTRADTKVTFVYTGLKLQQRLEALHNLTGDIRMREESSLRTAISRFRKQQLRLAPELESLIAELSTPGDGIESEKLYLPSDIAKSEHERYGLTDLADLEYHLREGQANDAISLICQGIKHKMLIIKDKHKQSSGVRLNTRSVSWIHDVAKKVQGWAVDYRRARKALLMLKDVKHLDEFPKLTDEDLKFKNAVAPRELGSGSSTDSWIWTYGSLGTLEGDALSGFIEKVERAQWFRTRADMMRWVEELEMLEEEFRRVIRALHKMGKVWSEMADLAQEKGDGYVAYARRQAATYRAREEDARMSFERAGGLWKPVDIRLSDWLRSRRPLLTVDWEAEQAEDRMKVFNVAELAEL